MNVKDSKDFRKVEKNEETGIFIKAGNKSWLDQGTRGKNEAQARHTGLQKTWLGIDRVAEQGWYCEAILRHSAGGTSLASRNLDSGAGVCFTFSRCLPREDLLSLLMIAKRLSRLFLQTTFLSKWFWS